MKNTTTLLSFNRGLMAPEALARIDLKRTALAAELQTNWMPRALGPMMLRPGLEYVTATQDNGAAILIPFVFATDDTAIVEVTNGIVRVLDHNEQVITRPTISSTVPDLFLWTDADEGAAVSLCPSATQMFLTGAAAGTQAARRRTVVTVAGGDIGLEHSLNLIVHRGRARLKAGTGVGTGEYFDVMLRRGAYSFALTPPGDFHVELSSTDDVPTEIQGVYHAPGPMYLLLGWDTVDLPYLRHAQSGDVLFVTGAEEAKSPRVQKRIARYGPRSWALEIYEPEDGPFRAPNISATTLTVSALRGEVTITASEPLFSAGSVGQLVRATSQGQYVNVNVIAEDQWSETIRVVGVGDSRAFAFALRGTWTATVTLQRAIGQPDNWIPVATYTTNQETPFNDALDNVEVYYRIGVATGDFGSGLVDADLASTAGSITGVARIENVISGSLTQKTATCTAFVLETFGGTTATKDWALGEWSYGNGFPTSVAFYDGRLWWAGSDKVWGSISDDFEGFDEDFEGDAGPIRRSLGSGPVDRINWLLPLTQLLLGTPSQELAARSSSFDEPLTPSAFRLLAASTQGSAPVQAVRIDATGAYVQRNGSRVYELVYDGGSFAYMSKDLTAVVPDIGKPGIVRMAVQRQPDTRVHCVRSDGKVALLVFDSAEEVNCWVLLETDGFVDEVIVLPGVSEDRVFYVVRRTIGGLTKRYIEKWTTEAESKGATVTKLMDSSKTYLAHGSATLDGLAHLEGKEVVVWADGRDAGAFTVLGGEVTLPAPVTTATVGLPYTAQFKSSKLAFSLKDGRTTLTQRQALDHLGLLLANTHAQGLRYGQDFDYLDDLPLIEQGDSVDPDKVWGFYEEDSVSVNGTWSSDARLCLEAASPRPCTVMAAVVSMATNFKD